MASLKDIRARIESTKGTQQITKALKMVSAAKLRRAQDAIVNLRPYAKGILSVIRDIAQTQRVDHPLLRARPEVKKVLIVAIASDRGLAGAFNSNINKFTDAYLKENKSKYEKVDLMLVGKRTTDYFTRRKVLPIESMNNLAKDVSYPLAAQVAEKMMKRFLAGQYDEIKIVYNEFKSAISQTLTAETLLPVDLSMAGATNDNRYSNDLIFEPAPEEIIEDLLIKHFTVQVYRCMCESVAAEHAARMTAMENASNNARDMINGLTLTYNKLRQASITTELIEIISGAEALKG
jgi:F-type H+-transporting ATPase subunit gamma